MKNIQLGASEIQNVSGFWLSIFKWSACCTFHCKTGRPYEMHAYVASLTFQVKKDPMNGESRGFGFVSFVENEVAEEVLGRAHNIMDRRCEVRLPRAKVVYSLLVV